MQRLIGHGESLWVLPCHTQQLLPTTLHVFSTNVTRLHHRYRFIERYAVASSRATAPVASEDVAIQQCTNSSTVRNITDEQVQLQRAAKSAKLSGDLSKSREILQLGLERYPGDKNFRVQLASVEAKLGRTTHALELLHEGLQEDPSNSFFLTSAASIYGQQRKYNKARELFQRGYSTARNSAPLLQVSSLAPGHC
jgi:predicted Zn-dependent protease